jgi:hypothetical protein
MYAKRKTTPPGKQLSEKASIRYPRQNDLAYSSGSSKAGSPFVPFGLVFGSFEDINRSVSCALR